MNIARDVVDGSINGLREIWGNKVRSMLSMSGIILGVAALVTMVGIVQGMLNNVRESFEMRGGILKLTIEDAQVPQHQVHLAELSPGKTYNDVIALRTALDLASSISPKLDLHWERFHSGDNRQWARLEGVTPDYLNIYKRSVDQGRFIADMDLSQKPQVIVIGSYIKDHLFPGNIDPIGKSIRIRDLSYTVIGVMNEIEGNSTSGRWAHWENRRNFIPLTTAMSRIRGTNEINELEVLAKSADVLEDLQLQIENTLIQTHRGIRDFEVRSEEEELQELRRLERSFTWSLGGIAGISLLVGGIGIMNVMLASVSERIREIGVRKAIGARGHDIFIQFLAEAMVVSVLGGILGLLLSVGLLELVKGIIPDGESIGGAPPRAMIFGFIFSSSVGLLSGIYPAIRAARLDPIEALRRE